MNDIASSQGFPGTGEGDILARHRHGGTGHRISIFIFPAQEFIILDRVRDFNCDRISLAVVIVIRRRGRTSGCRSVILVSHLVLLLPDCIQGIDTALNALIVDDVAVPSTELSFGCTRIRRPAQELIPIPGEAQLFCSFQGHSLIVGNVLCHSVAIRPRAAVGIINQGGGGSLVAPLGGEHNLILFIGPVSGNQQLIARLIDGIHTIKLPAQEYLAIRGCQASGALHICKGLLRIALAILRNGAFPFTRRIYNRKFLITGVVGVEGDIITNFGIKIEGCIDVSILGGPAVPGIPLGDFDLRKQIFTDLRAIGDGNGLRCTCSGHGQVDGSGHVRSAPLGVDRDVVSGHLFTGELKLSLARLIQIPTLESIIFRNPSGSLWLCAIVADICFVLNLLTRSTASVDEGQLIVISSIVERGTVIIGMLLCTWPLRNKSKAHQGIAVFL